MIEPTGRFTTAALPRHWYVACLASELGTTPIGRTVCDLAIALFRDRAGHAAALVDRCPHRNVPLSIGRCVGDELECRYHGWRFGTDGTCVDVPGLADAAPTSARNAVPVPCLERDGMIWVVPSFDPPAQPEPPELVGVGQPGYRVIHLRLDVPGPMIAALENALDVPHTSFLHRGLFRGRRERLPVEVTVRHGHDRVEAIFAREPVPPGVVGRVLAPDGGVLEHTDRFVMPCVAQVDYSLGRRHVVLNACYTPVGDDRCVLHAAAAYRLPIPTAAARAVVLPLAKVILRQDNSILEQQQRNVVRFGGERFVHTPIDLLGPHIVRLIRRHERGGAPEPERLPEDQHVTLLT